jgi:hypothetical protein
MIIGLLGKSKSGKDTAGAVLARELGGTCIAFADPMKRFCQQALGLTIRQMWGDQKEKPITQKQLKRIGQSTRKEWEARAYQHFASFSSTAHLDKLMEWWFGIHEEKGLTSRRVLQTFGTEFGRQSLGENFWVDLGLLNAQKVLKGCTDYSRELGVIKGGPRDAVIFTDVRFRNEVLALKRAGAKVYKVWRPSGHSKAGTTHASEAEQNSIPDFWFDGIFENTRSKEEFEADVKRFASKMKYVPTVVV